MTSKLPSKTKANAVSRRGILLGVSSVAMSAALPSLSAAMPVPEPGWLGVPHPEAALHYYRLLVEAHFAEIDRTFADLKVYEGDQRKVGCLDDEVQLTVIRANEIRGGL